MEAEPVEEEEFEGAYDPHAPITDADVLLIAQRHGSNVASSWSGRSVSAIALLRRRVGEPKRTPGRLPSSVTEPNLHCPCRRCIDWRWRVATRSTEGRSSRLPRVKMPGVWIKQAKCGGQTDLFFAKAGTTSYADPESVDIKPRKRRMATYKPQKFEPAKRICMTCPVREQCLEYAMTNNIRQGVWGGLDWFERDLIAGYLPTGKRFE